MYKSDFVERFHVKISLCEEGVVSLWPWGCSLNSRNKTFAEVIGVIPLTSPYKKCLIKMLKIESAAFSFFSDEFQHPLLTNKVCWN